MQESPTPASLPHQLLQRQFEFGYTPSDGDGGFSQFPFIEPQTLQGSLILRDANMSRSPPADTKATARGETISSPTRCRDNGCRRIAAGPPVTAERCT